ncbi:hypothetical protein QJS10_CPA09g01678 [Acorus calamus]|uniref:Tripeptidyl-peptidase 2 n=1 Tax=Acorus calamus TaxID=4465 RepID=A0AAV9E1Q5_ACOCL|nr:hypothetical protein QJS10_CPA09g01678 [Acorus calamus]
MPGLLVIYKPSLFRNLSQSSLPPPRSSFRSTAYKRRRRFRIREMPSSPSASSEISKVEGEGATGDGVDLLGSFKLSESTFLASLMPKKEIGADRFLESHPEYDGRGVLIAIFDSGVDPAAAGLQVTSDGKPKILDIIDCTGSGDIDTSKVVKADADGNITGASGTRLVVNPSWKNPSGEWRVGYKLVYELFTDTLISRLKKERRKKWDENNQEAISEILKQLNEFDKCYDDKGPVIDAVVWNDGAVWRVAIEIQTFEDDTETEFGKLAEFIPLTNYRIERKYGIFSKLDACSFVTNVYDEGNLLSIVTDCSPHGTHVSGIAAAFHHKEPLLNGVAPGAQIISCKIGDGRLGSMETGTGLIRALIAAVEHKCDLINMSYGEATLLPDYGCFVDLVVDKHRLLFISSAGNSGPALSTVGAPGGTSSSIVGVGAYVSPSMAAGAHCVVEPPSEGLEYTWSSRGPTVDGDLGVCVSAPGGAVAPVPTWTLQRRMLMNGTSMASPSACGGAALLISAMKAEGITVSPYTIRKALENTTISVGELPEDKLTTGQGLMQVDRAYEYLQRSKSLPCAQYKVKINQTGKSSKAQHYGEFISGRQMLVSKQASSMYIILLTQQWTVQVEPKFHEDASNLEQLVPFEECIQLHSSEKSVVRTPEYLLLTNNGRTFNIIVDPTDLSDGLHYYEVYVKGGLMMELVIAQFWSSGIGSHEATVVNFEIEFHGISSHKAAVTLDGSEAPVRIDTKALISSEKLVPAANLMKVRIPYRPIDSNLSSLTASRDKLPSGKQILSLTLMHANVEVLEKLKQLVLFIERKLDKKNCPPGSVLVGKISYGKMSLGARNENQNQQSSPVSYHISYVVPPPKLEEDKGKDTSSCTQSVSERLEDEQEYPKYTPLLSKILEGLLNSGADEDKIIRNEEIINAANEVVNSVDKEELAKYFSVKSDPDDKEAEGSKVDGSATVSGDEVSDGATKDSASPPVDQPDKFEENFKELKKWVDVKSSKYSMLVVVHERRCKRPGTTLKVLIDMIQDDSDAPKKKLYELKIELLDEIGWSHLASYERRWIFYTVKTCIV